MPPHAAPSRICTHLLPPAPHSQFTGCWLSHSCFFGPRSGQPIAPKAGVEAWVEWLVFDVTPEMRAQHPRTVQPLCHCSSRVCSRAHALSQPSSSQPGSGSLLQPQSVGIYLFGRFPEHITYSTPAPEPVTQYSNNAHQQRLARMLLVLFLQLLSDQLWEHSKQRHVSQPRLALNPPLHSSLGTLSPPSHCQPVLQIPVGSFPKESRSSVGWRICRSCTQPSPRHGHLEQGHGNTSRWV